MVHTAYTLAELAAHCLHRASKDWAARPANGTEWALPAIALLVASFDGWLNEILASLIRSTRPIDRAIARDLIYRGSLTKKYAAIPAFYGDAVSFKEEPQLSTLVSLRHEVMHPLSMPQGLPGYMRPLAERGLLLVNTEAAATHYAPFQLLLSYPLAYWAWNEANEAALALHHQLELRDVTSSYQLPVGLPVPSVCSPIRWHSGWGELGEPPYNRWERDN